MNIHINIGESDDDCASVFTAFVQSGDRISISELLKMHEIPTGGAVWQAMTVCAILQPTRSKCQE